MDILFSWELYHKLWYNNIWLYFNEKIKKLEYLSWKDRKRANPTFGGKDGTMLISNYFIEVECCKI